MQEFKGTRGNWTIMKESVKETVNGFKVRIVSKYGKELNSGFINATVHGRDMNQLEANAKLVAAAPEMLELLQELSTDIEGFNDLSSYYGSKIELLLSKIL